MASESDVTAIPTLWIAIYAAFVSTALLLWDIYKHATSGPNIRLQVYTDVELKFSPLRPVKPTDRFVRVFAQNIGDQPSTVINVGLCYYKSRWRQVFRPKSPNQAYNFPRRFFGNELLDKLDVGAQWSQVYPQTDDFTKMATDGYLSVVVFTTGGSQRTRVRLKQQAST